MSDSATSIDSTIDSTDSTASPMTERTLVLIKPDGMQFREAILRRIKNAGFVILQTRAIKLTPEQASEFYRDRADESNYSVLVMSLTEGPIQALCVAKPNAIEEMKLMVGPESYDDAKVLSPNSLRALFADSFDDVKNAIHVSDGVDDARYEIHYFFPNIILEPIHSKEEINRYLQGSVNATLMDGLFEVAKQRPDDPVLWLADYLMNHNPFKAQVTSPNSAAMEKIEKLERKAKKGSGVRSTTSSGAEVATFDD